MALFWLTHAAEPDDEDDPVQRLKMALILGSMFTPAEMRSQGLQEMANFMNINYTVSYRTPSSQRNICAGPYESGTL